MPVSHNLQIQERSDGWHGNFSTLYNTYLFWIPVINVWITVLSHWYIFFFSFFIFFPLNNNVANVRYRYSYHYKKRRIGKFLSRYNCCICSFSFNEITIDLNYAFLPFLYFFPSISNWKCFFVTVSTTQSHVHLF